MKKLDGKNLIDSLNENIKKTQNILNRLFEENNRFNSIDSKDLISVGSKMSFMSGQIQGFIEFLGKK